MQSEDLHLKRLKDFLTPTSDDPSLLNNRESAHFEFKEKFHFKSLPKYARTMAAFANTAGGYIVFGVTDSPKRLVGVGEDFPGIDSARISQGLLSFIEPALVWDIGTITFNDYNVGYIFTHEALEKPVVSKTNKAELKEGEIYYRYHSSTNLVRGPEIKSIIDERLLRERTTLLRQMEIIQRVGPLNIGILDTFKGHIHGPTSTLSISEDLLEKIKFIKEGEFSEKRGAPTLKLVGEVQPEQASGSKEIAKGIHYEDLVRAFTDDRRLTQHEAESFLLETTFLSTPFSPIFYIIKEAGITAEQAASLISATEGRNHVTNRIQDRLLGSSEIKTEGAISRPLPPLFSRQDLAERLASTTTAQEIRALLLSSLETNPLLLLPAVESVAPIRFFEAISHLSPDLAKSKEASLRKVMDRMFDRFKNLEPLDKTYLRKAIAALDEKLHRHSNDKP